MKKKKSKKPQTTTFRNRPVKAHSETAQNNSRQLLIILVLTFLAYIPALRAGFVSWDDPDYVNEQFFRQGLSNVKIFITTPIQGNYHPLTILSLVFNYLISGMNAWSYHLLNLSLHLVNSVLVFRLAFLLSGKNNIIAFVTAILFAIHPMHVESVAWITERKDVLYGLFFIAGLISYTKYAATASRKQYLLAVLFFILSLLAKPAAVIFPLALFCIDFLYKRKLTTKLFAEKIPFFVFALIIGYITYLAQVKKGAIDPYTFDAGTRTLMGFYGIMIYFLKMIFPVNLSPFYPYAPINEALPKEYYLSPFFFAALVVICFLSWKKNRVIAFGISFYLINLLLVLQFLPVGSAIIADRYTYIPYLGLFFIVGWIIDRFSQGKISKSYYYIMPVALLFSFLTFQQSSIWIDSAALWDHAIKVTPSAKAYDNRALLFSKEKDFDRAIEYYNEAIKINAIDKEAYTNRGNIYFDTKRFDLAFSDYKQAVSIDSNYYAALDNYGALYSMRGQFDSGLINLNRALTINPDYFPAYRNRALTFISLKQYENAIKDFNSVLKYQPNDPDVFNMIGVCYRLNGKNQEALTIINKALSIKPDPHFYLNRAYCYANLKNIEQAKKDALIAKQGGVALDTSYARDLGMQ